MDLSNLSCSTWLEAFRQVTSKNNDIRSSTVGMRFKESSGHPSEHSPRVIRVSFPACRYCGDRSIWRYPTVESSGWAWQRYTKTFAEVTWLLSGWRFYQTARRANDITKYLQGYREVTKDPLAPVFCFEMTAAHRLSQFIVNTMLSRGSKRIFALLETRLR